MVAPNPVLSSTALLITVSTYYVAVLSNWPTFALKYCVLR